MTRLTRKKSKKKTGGVGRLSVHTVQQMEEVPVAGIYSNMIFFFMKNLVKEELFFFYTIFKTEKTSFSRKKRERTKEEQEKFRSIDEVGETYLVVHCAL
jgi:hypothetical protein